MWRALVVVLALAACGSSTTMPSEGGCDPELGTCGDGCQTPDTDGDGWSDEVEIAMGTSAADPAEEPEGIVFVMPYQAPPRPDAHDVDETAKLSRADVAILLDTTGSMAGTTTRIQGELAEIVEGINAEIPDAAFGAAGYGDFPYLSSDNSQYDHPFYLVHRVMTAHTAAGLASITQSFTYKGAYSGIGNWFIIMRGGDEPEQHWEALRQTATGIGITYPDPFAPTTATRTTAPFNAATAHPATPPAGEEVGTIGGYGFRPDATPIVLMITDTNAHDGGMTTTQPVSATRAVALAALHAIGARVVGIMAWITVGRDDLTDMTIDTGGLVPPTAWGTTDRPANCPIGKCCVVAEDEIIRPQPDPINGLCPLVFQADRYTANLSKMVVQAITGIARGAKFRISAELRDDPSDDVDVTQFVDKVEALADCGTTADSDGDGVADTFPAVVGGTQVCFRITPKVNTAIESVDTARPYRATLQLTGDGVASFGAHEVWFVVPSKACTPPVLL